MKGILKKFTNKNVMIYLFGSWTKQKEKNTSDIDVGILGEELSSEDLTLLRIELEDSTIPYRVDIVDLRKVDEYFLVKVKKEGILWKG